LGEEIAPEDFEEPCRALGTSGGDGYIREVIQKGYNAK